MPCDDDRAAISALLQNYFDGLYDGDTGRLAQVFHPQAVYACAAGAAPVIWTMAEYFPVVGAREPPARRGDAREDRVLSVELIGGATALAKVQCAILPRRFTDLLSLIKVDGCWQIIAKVFHYDLAAAPPGAARLDGDCG